MSSPRGAAAKAANNKAANNKAANKAPPKTAHKSADKAARPAARQAAKPVAQSAAHVAAAASAEAMRLAADIERALADGRIDTLSLQALQALMAATCKAYAAQVEAGNPMAALAQRTTVTPTEVMVTASGLLRAANLAVFELGMWQSWTGR
jgi:hypothetical protein